MATDGTCVTKAVQPDPPPPSLPVVTIVTSSKMSSGAQQPPPMAATTATTTTAWMMSEEEASAAMAAAAGGGGDSGGQAVFVTVDTTQAPFPEMPIMVEATTTATDSLSQQQPLMTEQEALRAMGTLEAPPPPQIVVATKLDDLADAASVHAAPLITQQQQQQLVCGDCSAAFQDGEVLFQHWLEQHCRPQQQQRQVSSQQQEQQQKDRLELEQCCTCNHVFVKGTQRLADHVAKCAAKTPQGETPTAAASSLKRKSQEDLSCKQTPAPATPSKVSKRPGSSSSSSSSSLSMVSCGVCSTDVKTVTSFFLHWLDAHHQIVEVLEEVWQCGQCRPNRLFPSAPRLSAHVSEAHPFRRNVYQCGELDCGARYATMAEVEAHQHRVHHRQQGDGEGSPMEDECCRSAEVAGDLGAHFRKKHETTCELCGCQVEWCGSGASGGEMRSHLAQVHAFENVWNRSDSLSRITVTEAESKDGSATTKASSKRSQKQLRISPEQPAKAVIPRAQQGQQQQQQQENVTPQQQHQQQQIRCVACCALFTSEKLLEKHYYANHEFQCKFCDLKMDKDVYGDHLRAHLANERKRTTAGAGTGALPTARETPRT